MRTQHSLWSILRRPQFSLVRNGRPTNSFPPGTSTKRVPAWQTFYDSTG